ncbi:unnamed protein product [Camellia sinensis]
MKNLCTTNKRIYWINTSKPLSLSLSLSVHSCFSWLCLSITILHPHTTFIITFMSRYYYYYYYYYALFKLSTTSLLGLGFLLPPPLRLSRSRCGVRSGSILQFAGEKKKAYAFMEM